jgi:hypothetical protein
MTERHVQVDVSPVYMEESDDAPVVIGRTRHAYISFP